MVYPEIESVLASAGQRAAGAASTHNQALSAPRFLYREVLLHTTVYTHVIKVAAGGTTSPLDALATV
jgi:hypothetical protein